MGLVREPITVRPYDTLLQTLKVMITDYVPKAIVSDEKGQPLGIVTQKDILKFIYYHGEKRSFSSIRVSEFMQKEFISVKEGLDYLEAANIFESKKVPMLVITSQEGKIIGMIIKSDLAGFYASKIRGLHKVKDYMTKDPIAVSTTESVYEVFRLMVERNLGRVILNDSEGKVEGIITTTDMLFVAPFLRGKSETKVEDLMNPDPFVVYEEEDLASAAKLMATRKIKSVPVINDNGRAVGIITTSDMVKALTSESVREYLYEIKMYTTSF
ncbi:CBS domain-containing protein [Sulfuracidifex metallicus]|uniref:CBS domain-containing protein n=1 Tax=Sulfuracidifex metallicus TaxID=47303 RepID=UPI002273D986|nr:CBS domain-containing protein [Sulfuracidifex metallicus]MCY0849496.1 CBS domain-containing protein [Sulfuracidifex metallicus]